MRIITLILMGGLLLALPVSMAGMEFFSWTLFLTAFIGILLQTRLQGRQVIQQLKTPVDLWLAVYLFMALLVPFVAIDDAKARWDSIDEAGWVLLFYAYVFLLRGLKNPPWKKAYVFLSFIVSLACLYGLFQLFTGEALFRETNKHIEDMGSLYRATGFFNLPLTYAYSMGVLAFPLFGMWFYRFRIRAFLKKHKRHWLLPAVSVLALLAIFATGTRGAWIAVFVAGVIGLAFKGKKWVTGGVVITAAVVALVVALSPGFKKRFTDAVDPNDGGNLGRIHLYQANWQMYKDHPVLGVGLGHNRKLVSGYLKEVGAKRTGGHAHNTLLQMLVSLGPVGLMAYIGFCWVFLKLAYGLWKHSHSTENEKWIQGFGMGAFLAQIYLHIGGLTQCNFIDAETQHAVVFLWACVAVLAGKTRQ